MRYSPLGKPLCCSCRKIATHRTPYRMKNDAGKVEQAYLYHCQLHKHDGLSERLPAIETLPKVEVGIHDVVRYRGLLYRVVGKGSMPSSSLVSLLLRRIGPGSGLRMISVETHMYYPQVEVVKPYIGDWRKEQSVLTEMECRAQRDIKKWLEDLRQQWLLGHSLIEEAEQKYQAIASHSY